MAAWTEDTPIAEGKSPRPFDIAEQSEDEAIVRPRLLVVPPPLRRPKALPTTVDEAIAYGRGQVARPSQSWNNLCQSFCRHCYGVPAWSPTAIGAWERTPEKFKHRGGKVTEAPRGALLYYSGGPAGHVALAIGGKTRDKCLSNDYYRKGRIDVAPRAFPRWGVKYVGWSNWTPFGVMDLG